MADPVTALELKEVAVDNLTEIIAAATEDVRRTTADALQHLRASFDRRLWKDEDTLHALGGEKWFSLVGQALEQLIKAREQALHEGSPATAQALLEVVILVVDGDRLLARNAIDQSSDSGSVAKAKEFLIEARTAQDETRFSAAAQLIAKAWSVAVGGVAEARSRSY